MSSSRITQLIAGDLRNIRLKFKASGFLENGSYGDALSRRNDVHLHLNPRIIPFLTRSLAITSTLLISLPPLYGTTDPMGDHGGRADDPILDVSTGDNGRIKLGAEQQNSEPGGLLSQHASSELTVAQELDSLPSYLVDHSGFWCYTPEQMEEVFMGRARGQCPPEPTGASFVPSDWEVV
ncbi:hypothetical protein I6B53_07150 [Schaalia sp. 19OD2882]|uniref:hypothetical protein n=1 Tax=Schaalia sp. 19OD2882 TaxID=2794089 RepID=UPI001C1EA52E|nr:hypothetical protein [Schaalia sp. 19OD2882]QWW18919.1 hypothetical protein I6B53_07150 [Schaalia sp. 19OD2882]